MSELYRTLNSLLEMEKVFQGELVRDEFPKLNLWQAEDGLILTAEIPGLAAEHLELTLKDQVLTLSGEFPKREAHSERQYLQVEQAQGKFSRQLQLPYPVQISDIKAKSDRGILRVELPKSPAAELHTITIEEK